MVRLLFSFILLIPLTTLAIETSTIPAVVVTKQAAYSQTSGPLQIITQQEIQIAGITTLSQALQNLGGIQLEDMSGNDSQVLLSMRGFGANANSNVLMLVNGIPLTNPDIAPPDLNAIPLRNIAYIEIIEGSESVRYGDQAVGGIINIITQNQPPEKVSLTCGAGSYNAYNCYLTVSQQKQPFNYAIHLLDENTDNYRAHNHYAQKNLLGNIDYTNNSNKLTLNYEIANETMQYPGALTATQVAVNRRAANNNTDYFTDTHAFIELHNKYYFNHDWLIDINLASRGLAGNGVLMIPFKQTRQTQFIEPTLIGHIKQLLFTNGLTLEQDNYYLSSLYGITRTHQEKYGLFSIATWSLTPTLALSAGARGALQDSALFITPNTGNDINRALTTTLGITKEIIPGLHYYLRRAGSFRFPKADENAATPPGVNGLKTQTGVAYETGWKWQQASYSAKFGLYQLNLKNEIAYDPTQTPQDPFGVNRNLAPTVRRGFNVSGKKMLTPQLAIDGQYNFVDARFQQGSDAGKRIPLVSQHIIHIGLNDQFWENWAFYCEAIFTGNQYPDNDNANIGSKIGGYTIYNFNLHYTYQHLSAALHVNNIFNTNSYLYTVYQPGAMTEFYPAPGRNLMLTVSYGL